MRIDDEEPGFDSMYSMKLAAKLGSEYGLDASNLPDNIKRFSNFVHRLRDKWASELFADILSVRLFGPAALFVFVEFLRPLNNVKVNSQMVNTGNPEMEFFYPPFRYRLNKMIEAYQNWFNMPSGLLSSVANASEFQIALDNELKFIHTFIKDDITEKDLPPMRKPELRALILDEFIPFFNKFTKEIRTKIESIKTNKKECFLDVEDYKLIIDGVNDLRNGVPPDFCLNDKYEGEWIKGL